MRSIARTAQLLLLPSLVACSGEAPPPLPEMQLDPARVAVAGFSSGAIMAQQAHLAFSDRLLGAVLLAGPPYQCAQGSLDRALSVCLKPGADLDTAASAATVQERARRGALAPLDGLRGDRVLALHGALDELVPQGAARAALALYAALPPAATMQLEWRGDGGHAHVWPTPDAGGDCSATAPPYIGKCAIDLAGDSMRAMFGVASREAGTAAGELLRFDQSRFAPSTADARLADAGYLYRPSQCATPGRCGLLIVFHGCEQNAETIGEVFVRDSGYNRWADVHDVVVLYPQTRASYLPLNPKACWDWWGYTGADYDTRDGAQLQWLANATAALGVSLR
jgi:poly(3-hydroxybutyrate) depolymerase